MRYIVPFITHDTVLGAKDEKTLKKCKFQCLLRMWRGGARAVYSKWERHKLTQHAATSDFSLGVTYQISFLFLSSQALMVA